MFCQRANPVTGKMEWVCCEEDDDIKHEIARSTYAGMLHDCERNSRYYEGIRKAINNLKESGAKTSVLDIGTGSGILAMMAASSGADSITACEVFEPMAKIAAKVIDDNGFSNMIEVVSKRSTEMEVGKDKDLEEKANLLVTEIFDSELIGEGVLPTIRHARIDLLQERCKIVPHSARVHIQFAECDSLWRRHKLLDIRLPNGKSMKVLQSLNDCRGTAAVDELHIDALDDIKMLSDPVEAIRFNFEGCLENLSFSTRKDNMNRKMQIHSSGTSHCIILWWDLILDEEEDIILSMAPKISSQYPDKVVWRDHWMQAVYFLSNELHVVKGDCFEVSIFFDDYSFWFDVNHHTSKISKVVRPICTCGFHTVWSRERFSMCNNRSFWDSYCQAIAKIKTRKNAIVFGDVSLLPLFAAQYFDKILYVEFSQMSKDIVRKLAALNKLLDKIEVINIQDIDGANFADLLLGLKPDSVLAEPFFSSSLLPWEHLTFWYHHKTISNMSNSPLPVVIPRKGILKIVAVQFQDLWKARMPVNAIGDFKLDAFDAVIKDALQPEASDEYGLLFEAQPYALWEYTSEMISDIIDCGCFDFNTSVDDAMVNAFEGELTFNRNGEFHAIVAWVDFSFDEETSWTTGYDQIRRCWVKYSKQGIIFAENCRAYQAGVKIKYRITFVKDSCTLLFQLLQ